MTELQFRLAACLRVLARLHVLSNLLHVSLSLDRKLHYCDTVRNAFRDVLQHYIYIFRKTCQDVYTCDMLGNDDAVFAKKTLRSDILFFLNLIDEKALGKTGRFGTSGSTCWSRSTGLRFED